MSEIEVRQIVRVEVDEAQFTEAFMEEFREGFFQFFTVQEHKEHLAQLFARGIVDDDSFIEGYGPARDMGIRFREVSLETDILHD